ncbi:MAG TPA: glycosyltransferase 87 family protein, partial [Actinomycetota bacterium]|nr:glycosyltransferase 87 family protein [Actinomycetota bacterium]
MERGRSRSRLAIGGSIASFLFVALVAATPGSPFSPVLPASPAGPVTALAELIGLDALHGSAIAAVGVVAVAFAAAAFVVVLLECWRGGVAPRTVIGLAIAYHVALLLLPILFSRDVYSYAYYGKIAATYHANPYVATPLEYPADALAAFVGPKWVDTPAVYGPLWTQASSVAVRVAESIAAQVAVFRVVAIAASLATLLVVARTVRGARPEREAFAAALIGLNPVVLFQSAASGHNDLLVALSVAAAVALVFSGRELSATVALALGALIKVTAAVPLLLWCVAIAARAERGRRVRALVPHVGSALGLGLLAGLPFLNADDPTLGGLELASHEGWLAPSRLFHRVIDAVTGDALGFVPRIVFPLLLLGALFLIGRAIVRRAPRISAPLVGASWGWGLLCLMLLGPVLLPWYVTWALPLG